MKDKAELLAYSLLKSLLPVLPGLQNSMTECSQSVLAETAADIVCHADRCTSQKRSAELDSLFNRLNKNDGRMFVPYHILKSGAPIPCPIPDAPDPSPDLSDLQKSLESCLPVRSLDDVDAILERMEQYAACIPMYEDISLYDAAKLRCAVTACLHDCDVGTTDWEQIRSEERFLLFSFDTSGIQSFIYTITSKNALKGLRSRSFYLEIIMEVMADELLSRLELSRANLIYAGGGHAYLLLPNTESVKAILETFMDELHQWLLDTFQTSLYVASGMHPCSADALANLPEGRYREIFRDVSQQISEQKMRRYSAQELLALNKRTQLHDHECRVCRRSDQLNTDRLCSICAAMKQLGTDMAKAQYFTIGMKPAGQVLPFGYYLRAVSDDELTDELKSGTEFRRIYVKNHVEESGIPAHRLWMGDYISEPTFEELAEQSTGIRRLAVLRADVDNLGQAFVAGFPQEMMTLSRTSAFSGSLSRFFKLHINDILSKGTFSLKRILEGKKSDLDPDENPFSRHAAIVYAGGDDVFVVGAWDEIIGFAINLHNWLDRYSQGTLTISAGIGIYKSKYPISAMARETGALEDHSKQHPGKNAVTLFDESNRYSWGMLEKDVIGEKMVALSDYLLENKERGNSLLYQMMTLIRGIGSGERLNVARFAYLLARLRPEGDRPDPKKVEAYQKFAEKLYKWVQDPEECRKLLTAIQLYVYLTRKGEEKE